MKHSRASTDCIEWRLFATRQETEFHRSKLRDESINELGHSDINGSALSRVGKAGQFFWQIEIPEEMWRNYGKKWKRSGNSGLS